MIGAAIAAGGQHHLLRAEAVQRAIFQAPGHDATAGAFFIHDQVDGEVFDKEFNVMLQALLVQRVQDGMARAVGCGAGAGHRASP